MEAQLEQHLEKALEIVRTLQGSAKPKLPVYKMKETLGISTQQLLDVYKQWTAFMSEH